MECEIFALIRRFFHMNNLIWNINGKQLIEYPEENKSQYADRFKEQFDFLLMLQLQFIKELCKCQFNRKMNKLIVIPIVMPMQNVVAFV